MAGRPLGRVLGEPLARDGLERVGIGGTGGLALVAGVDAVRQQPAGFVAAVARHAQAHVGIGAQRQRVFLVRVGAPVFPAPPLRASRLHQQEQAASVGQLVRLGLRLGVGNGRGGKRVDTLRRGGNTRRAKLASPKVTPQLG